MKTLNEVLATARKSLPTADNTRELLVQALEHLKAVKNTADGAVRKITVEDVEDISSDIIEQLKSGDIVVDSGGDVYIVSDFSSDNEKDLVYIWNDKISVYSYMKNYDGDTYTWEFDTVIERELGGTKLYRHVTEYSFTGDQTGNSVSGTLYINYISTNSSKRNVTLPTSGTTTNLDFTDVVALSSNVNGVISGSPMGSKVTTTLGNASSVGDSHVQVYVFVNGPSVSFSTITYVDDVVTPL